MKAGIRPNSVQETLILPLWGRAEFSRQHPELFFDPEAMHAVRSLDCDFSRMSMTGYSGALYAIRQDALCGAAAEYLERHPRATVINLGCGLDSSFSRVDNGLCRWVNLDLPEVIEFRRRLMAPAGREECLGCDALDLSWTSRMDGREGVFVIAGGVFYYFRPAQVRALLCGLAETFPGGGVCFDCEGRWAMGVSNRLVKRTGNTGSPMYFSVGNAGRLFAPWSPRFGEIRTLCRLPEKYLRRGALPLRVRAPLVLGMRVGMLKFVQIMFRE